MSDFEEHNPETEEEHWFYESAKYTEAPETKDGKHKLIFPPMVNPGIDMLRMRGAIESRIVWEMLRMQDEGTISRDEIENNIQQRPNGRAQPLFFKRLIEQRRLTMPAYGVVGKFTKTETDTFIVKSFLPPYIPMCYHPNYCGEIGLYPLNLDTTNLVSKSPFLGFDNEQREQNLREVPELEKYKYLYTFPDPKGIRFREKLEDYSFRPFELFQDPEMIDMMRDQARMYVCNLLAWSKTELANPNFNFSEHANMLDGILKRHREKYVKNGEVDKLPEPKPFAWSRQLFEFSPELTRQMLEAQIALSQEYLGEMK